MKVFLCSLLLSVALAQLKLDLEITLEDSVSSDSTCDMTLQIDNQRHVSYLGRKGAVLCFADA